MAAQWRRFAIFVVIFLTLHSAFSVDPPKSSPSPAPEVGADANITPPPAKSPASSPDNSSRPASPPSTNSSGSPSPTPAPKKSTSHSSPSPSPSSYAADSDDGSPSPAPSESSRSADFVAAEDSPEKKSGGMSPGKKVVVALGVLVGVGVIVVAEIIYKKRLISLGWWTRSFYKIWDWRKA